MEMLFYVQHPDGKRESLNSSTLCASVITFMRNRYSQVKLLKALRAPQHFLVSPLIPLSYSQAEETEKLLSFHKYRLMSCISFVTDPVTVFRCYKLCVFFLLKQSLIHKYDSVDLYAELVFVTYITTFNTFEIQV